VQIVIIAGDPAAGLGDGDRPVEGVVIIIRAVEVKVDVGADIALAVVQVLGKAVVGFDLLPQPAGN
jgi:hypothetical protein